ncbi:16912_t:CDS:2 [Funneliformis mosseae]|uniref:16912_t:CDS:1 n=1 Tax=Funneliformis mosseae TaxID=27381 RepID=A0A9N8ZW35_FUNMO|nr:16912_t:CDS:2 [Funneliformis mosseae]
MLYSANVFLKSNKKVFRLKKHINNDKIFLKKSRNFITWLINYLLNVLKPGINSSHGNFSNQDKEFICECVEEYLKTIGKIKWKQLQKRMQKDRCVPCSQIDLKNVWNLKHLREGGAEAPDEEYLEEGLKLYLAEGIKIMNYNDSLKRINRFHKIKYDFLKYINSSLKNLSLKIQKLKKFGFSSNHDIFSNEDKEFISEWIVEKLSKKPPIEWKLLQNEMKIRCVSCSQNDLKNFWYSTQRQLTRESRAESQDNLIIEYLVQKDEI